MRRRSKRVSTWLGLALLGAAPFAAPALWHVSSSATAQEQAGSPTQVPRDVARQPLVAGPKTVEADAPTDADASGAGVFAIDAGSDETMASEASPAAPPALPGGTPMETVTVLVDHAKVVRLPENTQTVIVGNPIVADVTVQRNGILIVTGKSYGSTNLIALDPAGILLAESMISVQAPTESVVLVQRGLARESYSCTPTCQPSLRLGDSPDYFGGVGNQATQRNTLATQR